MLVGEKMLFNMFKDHPSIQPWNESIAGEVIRTWEKQMTKVSLWGQRDLLRDVRGFIANAMTMMMIMTMMVDCRDQSSLVGCGQVYDLSWQSPGSIRQAEAVQVARQGPFLYFEQHGGDAGRILPSQLSPNYSRVPPHGIYEVIFVFFLISLYLHFIVCFIYVSKQGAFGRGENWNLEISYDKLLLLLLIAYYWLLLPTTAYYCQLLLLLFLLPCHSRSIFLRGGSLPWRWFWPPVVTASSN